MERKVSNYREEGIAALSQEIKQAGFRVFLAESGTYGFFTDAEGTRVVGFQYDLGGVSFSGNYKTDQPRTTGTGWGMGIPTAWSAEGFRSMFESGAPIWAVSGIAWKYTTLAQHLATYQASSKYSELM